MITAVCISKDKQSFNLRIPFVSYTENYRPITTHDTSPSRISYMTGRYNAAVKHALQDYPETEHILMIDHYYLTFAPEVQLLLEDYKQLGRCILGASIWYWARRRIRPWIAYYDTLSVPEFEGKKWWRLRNLPNGIVPVTGVGACWVFPRKVWQRTDGFTIPSPPQAGSSRCLDTSGYPVLLDCNIRLWRTHQTNPAIPDDPMGKRVATSFKHARHRLFRSLRREHSH
jgi:hypothetical protein